MALRYLSAHQRELVQPVNRRQNILDSELCVMWRLSRDEALNGLKIVGCLECPANYHHFKNLALRGVGGRWHRIIPSEIVLQKLERDVVIC